MPPQDKNIQRIFVLKNSNFEYLSETNISFETEFLIYDTNLTMSHYQMKTSSLDHIKPNTLFAAKSMTANGVTVQCDIVKLNANMLFQ